MFGASPRVDFGSVPRPAFGRAAQHLPATAAPHRGKSQARYLQAAKTAAELLPELPARGETVHALMLGYFDLMQVIAATLARLPDCTHLRIATLCYNRRNQAEILGILEARPTLSLTLLVSGFFVRHNKDVHEAFREELSEYPKARIASAATHCKVTLFDVADDSMVFESSANLRTNRSREQLTVFRDRGLHDWHAAWIDELVKADDGESE